MRFLGLDIGGVHTKAALVERNGGEVRLVAQHTEAFHFRRPLRELAEQVPALLRRVAAACGDGGAVRAIAVTTTAESIGVFPTLADGVRSILQWVRDAFPTVPVQVMTTEAGLVPWEQAMAAPMAVASANWAATAALWAPFIGDGLLLDMGSTTTDIVPIRGGRPVPSGKTDLERLQCSELVYVGLLRTPVTFLASRVKVGRSRIRLASESRAYTAHLHSLLDGAPPFTMPHPVTGTPMTISPESAFAALARNVCSDRTHLSDSVLLGMARQLRLRQLHTVAQAAREVIARAGLRGSHIRAAAVGIGREPLLMPLCRLLNWEVVEGTEATARANAPAVAVATLCAREVKPAWTAP